MPTYEYRCAKCGQHLEVFQSFSEAPLTKHKTCGGKLAKVLSPAGIVLKGAGFYKTDARASASKGKPKDKQPAEAASSASSGSGSDSPGSDAKNSDSKGSGTDSSKSSGPDQGSRSSQSESKSA